LTILAYTYFMMSLLIVARRDIIFFYLSSVEVVTVFGFLLMGVNLLIFLWKLSLLIVFSFIVKLSLFYLYKSF